MSSRRAKLLKVFLLEWLLSLKSENCANFMIIYISYSVQFLTWDYLFDVV